MRSFDTLDDLEAAVGEQLGYGDWLEVTQEMVNDYAAMSGDDQWIHVDVQRAAEGPFGGTIAHGYLTITLLPKMIQGLYRLESRTMGVNYGVDRVRFTNPVPVGARLRATAVISEVKRDGNRARLKLGVTVHAENNDQPVCVAEPMVLLYE